jgi:DNA-binding NarL/FixJ family response regulator
MPNLPPRRRVYFAEDSEIVVARLRAMTEAAGCEVAGNASGVTGAMKGLLEQRPDAAIVDLDLDDGSGLEVLRQARKELPGLLVIILTNHSSAQHRAECLAAGADHFLDKSYDFERLPGLLAGGEPPAAVTSESDFAL